MEKSFKWSDKMKILLYDGECGFCNFWVQWVLKNDQKKEIQFSPLQGDFAKDYFKKNNLKYGDFDTIHFIDDQKKFQKLDAISEIGVSMGGIYKFMYFLRFIPNFIGNKVYDIIAENRKKLMGEACLLLSPEEKKRFI